MSFKFENLKAWQEAKDLVLVVYKCCDRYPKNELYSLVSQTTRAAVSIMANIAEGSSRQSKKDFYRFLEIALGSAFELESLLIIAAEREYIDPQAKIDLDKKISDVEKLITGLMRSLNV